MELHKISDQNYWWKFGAGFDPYDPDIGKLKNEWTTFERRLPELTPNTVTTLLGPRQVGKTSLIKQSIAKLLKSHNPMTVDPRTVLYLSCDSLVAGRRRELSRALHHFFSLTRDASRRYVFIDEIGRVEDWEIELKELMDSGTLRETSLVITGSFVRGLERFAELFPGRPVVQRWITPVSFRDFVTNVSRRIGSAHPYAALFKAGEATAAATAWPDDPDDLRDTVLRLLPFESELQFFWELYLRTGGFPHVVNDACAKRFGHPPAPAAPASATYETYAKVAVDDVVRLGRPERILRQVLHAIIKSTGSRTSLISIAKGTEDGITHVTLGDYLDILRQSQILRVCMPCDLASRSVRPKANRKIYFTDPFLFYSVRAWLAGFTGSDVTDQILQDEMATSQVVELVVGQHLVLCGIIPFMREPDTFFWYYYDQQREIDFVYRSRAIQRDLLIGIEVKYQEGANVTDMPPQNGLDARFLLTKCSTDLTSGRGLMVPTAVFLAALRPADICM